MIRSLCALALVAAATVATQACSPFSGNGADGTDAGTSNDAGAADGATPDAATESGSAPPDSDAQTPECTLTAPTPKQLATGQIGVVGIAADHTGVYWSNDGTGEVWKYDFCQQAARKLYSGKTPNRLAVWNDELAVADAATKTLTIISTSTGDVLHAIMGITPKWVAHLAGKSGASGYWVWSSPPDTVAALSDAPGGSDVVVTLSNAESNPWGIAADSASGAIYWCNSGEGVIRTGKASAGSASDFVFGQTDCRSVAFGGGVLFWANYTAGAVVGATSSDQPMAYATKQAGPDGIAADGTAAYWIETNSTMPPVDGGAGTLWTAKRNATMPTSLGPAGMYATMPSLSYFQGVAVDETNIYWVDYDNGIINALGKP